MNEVSLFTGAGGGLLGSHLLGWRPIAYVEIEEYCQRLIRQRIEDGILPEAPIFGDVRAFISEGHADLYRGVTDIVTAGFPCQPFSVAGKKLGEDDPRNMWPATIEAIRRIRPRYALLENVPGLLTHKYYGRILGDLAESGYDARWCCISAGKLGAHHLRERVWILAYTASERWIFQERESNRTIQREKWNDTALNPALVCKNISSETCRFSFRDRWKTIAPQFQRDNDDVAGAMDRLRAIGNGQVPAVVRAAWRLLSE